jgi:hypothetical protein
MNHVTVEHLAITVAVEAREGEVTFARMFDTYIRAWHQQMTEQQTALRDAERERMLPTTAAT